jgi:predicted small lipoprotein YifL
MIPSMIKRLACSAFLALMLAGCGLKGDLYLPDPKPPADQAPAATEAPTDERDAAETETP